MLKMTVLSGPNANPNHHPIPMTLIDPIPKPNPNHIPNPLLIGTGR